MADAFLKLVAGGTSTQTKRNLRNVASQFRQNESNQSLYGLNSGSVAASIKLDQSYVKDIISSTGGPNSSKHHDNKKQVDVTASKDKQVKPSMYTPDPSIDISSSALLQVQRKNDISVQGEYPPPITPSFQHMYTRHNVPRYIISNILSSVDDGGFGFTIPTPIQMQTVPALMDNRDVMSFAPTGSGKTLGFAIPMLTQLHHYIDSVTNQQQPQQQQGEDNEDNERKSEKKSKKSSAKSSSKIVTKPPQKLLAPTTPLDITLDLPIDAIILCPTRELALQTYRVFSKLVRIRPEYLTEPALTPKDISSATQSHINIAMLTKKWKTRFMTTVKGTVTHLKNTGMTLDEALQQVTEANKARIASKLVLDDDDDTKEQSDIEDDDADDDGDDDDNDDTSTPKKGTKASSSKTIPKLINPHKHTILIATPMMLISLLKRLPRHNLTRCQTLVIDETDRLFDYGFLEQMNAIISRCTNILMRKVLVSATITQSVTSLASSLLTNPIKIVVGGENVAQLNITQELRYVGSEDGKLLGFRQLLTSGTPLPMIVFVQSKERAVQFYNEFKLHVGRGILGETEVSSHSSGSGRPAIVQRLGLLHSSLTEHERLDTISKFRTGQLWILVCTDIMARGLDFVHVKTVLNYDFPQSETSYIHRIGRTGRGGRNGLAITFVTDDDKPLLRNIADIVQNAALAKRYGYEFLEKHKNLGGKHKDKLIQAQQQQYKHDDDNSDDDDDNNNSSITTSSLSSVSVPDWMLTLPRANKTALAQLQFRAPKRDDIMMDKTFSKKKRQALDTTAFHRKTTAIAKLGLVARNEQGIVLKDKKATKRTQQVYSDHHSRRPTDGSSHGGSGGVKRSRPLSLLDEDDGDSRQSSRHTSSNDSKYPRKSSSSSSHGKGTNSKHGGKPDKHTKSPHKRMKKH